MKTKESKQNEDSKDNVLEKLKSLTKEEKRAIRKDIKNHLSPFFEGFTNPLILTSFVRKK